MKNAFEFKTLAEFLEYFKDEDTCRQHFAGIRFRNGEYCAHCGHTKIYTFQGGKRYRCAKCKQDFTIKTGTVFGESKLPIKKWFIAIYLLSTTSKGISSVQLAKHVGVTQKTGWFMDHRIRKAMKQNGGQLFGTIEADETFIGGKEENKHLSKRVKGGNPKGKTMILGFVQRGGEARAHVTDGISLQKMETASLRYARREASIIYTDSFRANHSIGKVFPHEMVNHLKKEYVRGDVHTNTIESFWALFKRGYHGVYHQMSKKHIQKYVDEFVFRFNNRTNQMQNVFSDVVARVTETPVLPYRDLIA